MDSVAIIRPTRRATRTPTPIRGGSDEQIRHVYWLVYLGAEELCDGILDNN
jgi:hypothetical protein